MGCFCHGVAIEDRPKLVLSTYMNPCLPIWTESCGTCKPMVLAARLGKVFLSFVDTRL